MAFVPTEIIKKKRDGGAHSREEIQFLIDGFVDQSIPNYQVAAWLMAVYQKGMTDDEAGILTQRMLHSGEILDFSELPAPKVDKHSTGGVGDKTSLILAPIVAAAGVYVPMMSGRGLGHSGGTLDKLESIPGFVTQLNLKRFRELVSSVGTAMIGQTETICPADKKLYALRDVTGTVESIPLICSSIMSKKLAEGIDGLVLDVKFGSGAFMKTYEDAKNLASKLVAIAKKNEKSAVALLTSMEQPLGRFVGCSLEVEECLAILRNEDSETVQISEVQDTVELSLALAGHMIWLGQKSNSPKEGIALAKQLLDSGKAYELFEKMCAEQGGDLEKIPKAKFQKDVIASKSGYIEKLDTEAIGMASVILGAGRLRQTDEIDPTAGLKMHIQIGDKVDQGDSVATIYANSQNQFEEASERLQKAIHWTDSEVPRPELIKETIL